MIGAPRGRALASGAGEATTVVDGGAPDGWGKGRLAGIFLKVIHRLATYPQVGWDEVFYPRLPVCLPHFRPVAVGIVGVGRSLDRGFRLKLSTAGVKLSPVWITMWTT